MQRFRRQFVVSLTIMLVVLVAPLVTLNIASQKSLPPKPPYPIIGREFVGEYAGVGAFNAQAIYYWNLFGIGDRIRDADVVLLGSSHTQFDLSAQQLSNDLSQSAMRPVRVFNLGMGCGETLAFANSVIERLEVHAQIIIADTYTYGNDDKSECATEATRGDAIQAAVSVSNVWSRFTWDWLIDGYLPSLSVRDDALHVERFLNAPVLVLDWNFGGSAYFYRPDAGQVFPDAPPDRIAKVLGGVPGEIPWALADGAIPIPPELRQTSERKPEMIFTLIPFPAAPTLPLWRLYQPAYQRIYRLLSTNASGEEGRFVAISPSELESFDYGHLTGAGRAIATARLAHSLEQRGLLAVLRGR
jgi:hypothetical protein